jgi:hypothetical protein
LATPLAIDLQKKKRKKKNVKKQKRRWPSLNSIVDFCASKLKLGIYFLPKIQAHAWITLERKYKKFKTK